MTSLYLTLYNSQKSEGLTLGPYENIQITYGHDIKMYSGELDLETEFCELFIDDAFVEYDGEYYSNLIIHTQANPRGYVKSCSGGENIGGHKADAIIIDEASRGVVDQERE